MSELETSSAYKEFISARRAELLSRIEAAAKRSGRSSYEITLAAVSKTVDVGEVLAAMQAGYTTFAENRPQELVRKLDVFSTAGLEAPTFHMIGNLQKNKINAVLGRVELIQSISSERLAQDVSMRAQRSGLCVPVLLECNVSGEQSKSGFAPQEVLAAAESLMALPGISIQGTMTMAPAHSAGEARKTFSGLRELTQDLRGRTGLVLPTLSCGMSDDFEIAVEEGSTLVRLGRVVFSREYTLE